MKRSRCVQDDPADERFCVGCRSPARRTVLKVGLGWGVGLGWSGSASPREADRRAARPGEDDRFVLAGRGRGAGPVGVADVRLGDPPVTAYPMDPATGMVRDQSRLNQVLLIHLDPTELGAETRTHAAEGIVAYSAICTHTGCDSWEWQAQNRTIKCPCPLLSFVSTGRARLPRGPAPRRAARPPLLGIR